MPLLRAPAVHRACLPLSTTVEDWSVQECLGHGASGVVHRAVRIGQESAGPVAFKRALYPWDPRFLREVGLLSLIHHPSIPRLLGHGFWKHPSGGVYPFIIMDWIDGSALYDWAREHNPSSRQVFRLLGQLARALQAVHESSAVHRDVKGDNVLVRRSDGRAMLTDFGAGTYQAAARVTDQPLPPGTAGYRSPEAILFSLRSIRSPQARYMATPADDLFALGTTAYRLVTGYYPPAAEPHVDEQGSWSLEQVPIRPPRELNPHVEPQLSELILRMLSPSPKARGTAAELAEALEAATESADSAADQPLIDEVQRAPARPKRAHSAWRALALVGMCLALLSLKERRESPAEALAGPPAGTGSTSVADKAQASPPPSMPTTAQPISQDQPPEPFQGQLRPNERGQCPSREQVALNGGCWVESRSADPAACAQNGYLNFQGKCYSPAIAPRRKPEPTSTPPDFR